MMGRKVKCSCGIVMRMPQANGASVEPPQPSSEIRFDCPQCKQRLSVPAESAGQISLCVCGLHVRVPLRETPVAAPAALPTATETVESALEPANSIDELQPLDDPADVGLAPMDGDPFSPMVSSVPNSSASNPQGSYLQPSKPQRSRRPKKQKKEKEPYFGKYTTLAYCSSGIGMILIGIVILMAMSSIGLRVRRGGFVFLPTFLMFMGFLVFLKGILGDSFKLPFSSEADWDTDENEK